MIGTMGADAGMTHVYQRSIHVTLANGALVTIRWRDVLYRVLDVFESWHLQDRWWEQAQTDKGPSDRTYYRVRCASQHIDLICEIYFDAATNVWVLERIYD